jgi:hypothetical protein
VLDLRAAAAAEEEADNTVTDEQLLQELKKVG